MNPPLSIGKLPHGPLNLITDVPGVRVGHCTVWDDHHKTGVTVVLEEDTWYLRVGEKTLDAGSVSPEKISPAACLPRLMHALRNGWLLEENEENWQGVACRRVAVDQSGEQGTILTTLWLRQEDGTPLRGEIAVDGERVLTAEFTSFAFCDTRPEAASAPQ